MIVFAGVRGRGLMQGAVLREEHATRAAEILDAAAAEGLLVLSAGVGVLRLVARVERPCHQLHEATRVGSGSQIVAWHGRTSLCVAMH